MRALPGVFSALGEFRRGYTNSLALSAGIAPIGDFLQPFRPGLLEKTYAVARVFKFVDIGPYLGLPGFIVDRRLATSGTAGMQLSDGASGDRHWA